MARRPCKSKKEACLQSSTAPLDRSSSSPEIDASHLPLGSEDQIEQAAQKKARRQCQRPSNRVWKKLPSTIPLKITSCVRTPPWQTTPGCRIFSPVGHFAGRSWSLDGKPWGAASRQGEIPPDIVANQNSHHEQGSGNVRPTSPSCDVAQWLQGMSRTGWAALEAERSPRQSIFYFHADVCVF